MKSYSSILRMISNYVPYEVRRRTGNEWMIPAFLGVGLGVAAGVGIGILLAPAPGHETRRQLKDGAYRMKDRALDAAQRAKGKVAELRAETRESERTFLDEVGNAR